jgi:NitT/TauT family transport system ATP-binding protein
VVVNSDEACIVASDMEATGKNRDRPRLKFEGVSRQFGIGKEAFTAVTDIDLTVSPGEFICIVGPSGCGKSTLLNMAAGLLKPSTGHVLFDGDEIRRINTKVGYVTQKDSLLPWRTTERNVSLPLELHGVPRSERNDRVTQILARVGLLGSEKLYPAQLSGGMRKRAALAQTLVYRPTTLLMDEPFGALDAQLRMSLQRDLLLLVEQEQQTILFVTHDLEEAILLGDRVVVFSSHPGRIIHIENVSLPRPRDLVSLRSTPEFNKTWEGLWNLLAPELGSAI